MSQPRPLLEQLKNLEQLQELDLKIDLLKKGQSVLPATLKSMDQTLNQLKASLDLKRAQITEVEKSHRQTKAALDLNQDRLTRSSGKLEQSNNSQEFQAATKEIEQIKKLYASLEDQSKKSTSEVEAMQKDVDLLDEKHRTLAEERDSKAVQLTGQDTQFNSDIASLSTKRLEFASTVEAKIMTQYNRVRAARGGIGIVPAVNGRCKGCNMMVPPQLYNEIQRGSVLHDCPSCHRLLFIPVAPTEVKDSAAS